LTAKAKEMSGVPVAEAILSRVRGRLEEIVPALGRSPVLATVLVGDNPASASYVRMKHAKAKELGISVVHQDLPGVPHKELVAGVVKELSLNDGVDAILIQYPLPAPLSYEEIIEEVAPEKDVDGLHPVNLGRLALSVPGPLPCTPAGIKALLDHYGVALRGAHVVVVGRGLTVGRPLSLLLSGRGIDATVTLVHSLTPDIGRFTRQADVIVAAAGRPGLIKGGDVKEGAVVVTPGVAYEGRKVLVDITDDVWDRASLVTPRIGGVGPLTVAMLFHNVIELTAARLGRAT
jgi:methylenetetrahydrofolate dehydrogenase (NADP+)/methenyltetrahydrofolate cyclohydrolase